MRRLILATVIALAAGPALAQAMKVGDLGAMASRLACMQHATAVLEAYVAEHGGHSVIEDNSQPESWSVYGWGLRPGVNDVVIICPVVTSMPNAFYTIHSAGPEATQNATFVAARIDDLWQNPR